MKGMEGDLMRSFVLGVMCLATVACSQTDANGDQASISETSESSEGSASSTGDTELPKNQLSVPSAVRELTEEAVRALVAEKMVSRPCTTFNRGGELVLLSLDSENNLQRWGGEEVGSFPLIVLTEDLYGVDHSLMRAGIYDYVNHGILKITRLGPAPKEIDRIFSPTTHTLYRVDYTSEAKQSSALNILVNDSEGGPIAEFCPGNIKITDVTYDIPQGDAGISSVKFTWIVEVKDPFALKLYSSTFFESGHHNGYRAVKLSGNGTALLRLTNKGWIVENFSAN